MTPSASQSPTGLSASSRRISLPDRIACVMAVFALILAVHWMAKISPTDPWVRNLDMNMQNTADALAINSNIAPNLIDQPGMQMKFLLALDFRVQHFLGFLPIWNMKKFGASPDPLREIPPLIRAGRLHSRVIVIAMIIAAGFLTYAVTGKIGPTCLSIILLCGSTKLLFHGLLTRPELLCVGFGITFSLLFAWKATKSRTWKAKYLWLILAGLFGGLAALEKLPGICYLGLAYAWCWIPPSIEMRAQADASQPNPTPATGFWRDILAMAGGLMTLGLLIHLSGYFEAIDPVALKRMRLAAVSVSLLPLVALRLRGGFYWRFLIERIRELSLLAGGALMALMFTYLLLRSVLSESQASDYFARMLHYVFDPVPMMKILLDSVSVSQVLLMHVKQSLAPLLVTGALAIGIMSIRKIPLLQKGFIVLLLAGAFGMIFVMSKRHYTIHYGLFIEVPLLIALAICFNAMIEVFYAFKRSAALLRWSGVIVCGVALVVTLTMFPRLHESYEKYQDDSDLSVNSLNTTFLFDHDAHTEAYRKIMRDHYINRGNFSRVLNQYLSTPANRY